MPFQYSCFISYSRSKSEFMKTFLEDLKNTLESYICLYVNKEVYIDTDRLGPGYHYDMELSRVICQSICMIVVYTPSYKDKDHLYCQREYMAMEDLEKKRIKKLGGRINNSGMIIPIILRGDKADLPSNIKEIQYLDFSKFTTASPRIDTHEKYIKEIEKIATTVYDYYRAFDAQNIDPCCDCDSFSLPNETDIEPWGKQSTIPKSHFPWRGE